MIFEIGCTNCDGPSYGVARAYRPAGGEVAFEMLFSTNTTIVGVDGPNNILGLPTPVDGSAYRVTGVAASTDGSEIFVTLCCGPFEPAGSGETLVVRSNDGGVTWAEWQRLPDIYAATAVIAPGKLLVGAYAYGAEAPFTVLPDGEILTPPVRTAIPAIVNGELVWVSDKGLHRGDQVFLLAGEEDAAHQFRFYPPSFRPFGTSAIVSIYQSDGFSAVYCLAEIQADWGVSRFFFSPDHHIDAEVWLNEHQFVTTVGRNLKTAAGNPFVGPFEGRTVPGIVDTSTATVHAIPDPFAQEYTTRRAIAVQRGPFARVVHTDGDCLNIRSEPGSAGQALDCAAEGVLLTDLGPFQFV